MTSQYAEFVSGLAKPGEHIIRDLNPSKAHLFHMASSAMGEAGELFDAVKKHAIYGKPIDKENVLEELGDVEFYLQGIRNEFGWSREDVIAANVLKLRARYPHGYTDKSAIERKDKQ